MMTGKNAKTLRRLLPAVLAAVGLALAANSCHVHEWPDPDYDGEAPFLLHLDFSTEMPLYKEILYTRAGQTPHDMRYTVQVYRTGEARTDGRTFVFTRPEDLSPDCTLELSLEAGEYDFFVWADYVESGSLTDKYYDTGDFNSVTLISRDSHAGSEEHRDAFRGFASATVLPLVDVETDTVPGNEVRVPMQRPMGRYEFISTDADLFLERVAKARGLALFAGTSAAGIDLGEFRVVFSYNAFMPCTFNLFTDKPSDSWTGVRYESRLELTGEGIAMGFDYIFVNGAETLMNLRVDVYDAAGELVASVPSVEVPVVRGRLTLVKGEFLTSYGSGGVAVNPGFDGPDYNVEIK